MSADADVKSAEGFRDAVDSPTVSEDTAGTHQHPETLVHDEPKKTWKSYVWDTLDKSPEERRFLFKIDAVLLTFASLGYFIKYLDQINVNNAFVSGMKEDLGLYGNQLNYMQTCWTVGYVVGEIPRSGPFVSCRRQTDDTAHLEDVNADYLFSNMLLTRLRPSIWIPACEVTWATLTILMVTCTNVQQIYVLRFFIGLAEGGFYPGMQYIIGSWYRRDELAKRSCIFHCSSALGTMFSGYLMAAVYHLDGKDGFHGWQWLFIIDTVISLPIAVAGFFILPDVPEITRAWYLSKRDVEIAQERMELEGRAKRSPYTKEKFLRIFSSWHIYLLPLAYILFNNGNAVTTQPTFSLWLKDRGASVHDINTYPTITSAITVLTTLVYAWTSDTVFRGARWPPIVFAATVNLIVYISLTVWDIPLDWKWACFFLAGFGQGMSGLLYAWAHEICGDDNEERALVTATMNEMAYVVQAWLPLLVWQQVEAPEYPKGYPTMVGIAVALIATTLVIRFLHKREARRKAPLQATQAHLA